MYLNLINSIKYENKRKTEKLNYSHEHDSNKKEKEEIEYTFQDSENSYYSIFYGDLTKNWLKLNSK